MTCDETRSDLLLLLYGELAEPRRREAEAHLEQCETCRLLLAEERRLQAILALRPAVEPTGDLLERCRGELSAALRRVRPARPPLRIPPALAATLLVAGFLAGWMSPWRTPLGRVPLGRSLLERAPSSDPASIAAGLRSLAIDPGTGRVRLTYETPARASLEGAPSDPEIRPLLLDTVRRSPNAGLRLDALETLRGQASDGQVLTALLEVIKGDSNPGARLRAIDVLQGQGGTDETVRDAIVQALLSDRNPGVRVRAIDFLASARGPETLPVLERLASDDASGYVRLRSAAAVEAAYRSREGAP